jgi:hypothetical protein
MYFTSYNHKFYKEYHGVFHEGRYSKLNRYHDLMLFNRVTQCDSVVFSFIFTILHRNLF